MKLAVTRSGLAAMAFATLFATPAVAGELVGMIVARNGHQMVVRGHGVDTPVLLTPATKVRAITGALGAQREKHPQSDLINGLAVTVETVEHGDTVEAARVTFKPKDLKTAMAVQAGVAQAKEQIQAAQAENMRRLSQVGQFAEKGRVRVYFATGSAAINAKGGQDLHAIVRQAKTIPGALLRVVGHADSTGNAAANQRLSSQRASAVTAYLLKRCNVPAERIVGATGLGASLSDDGPSKSKAEDRRVTVFILVSKAASG